MSLSQALTYYISESRQSIFRQNLQNPPTRLRRDRSAYGQEKLRVARGEGRGARGEGRAPGGAIFGGHRRAATGMGVGI